MLPKFVGVRAEGKGEPAEATGGRSMSAEGKEKKEAAPAQVLSGCRVQLMGLQAKPELNGQFGTAETLDPDSGRWVVRLNKGQCLKVGTARRLTWARGWRRLPCPSFKTTFPLRPWRRLSLPAPFARLVQTAPTHFASSRGDTAGRRGLVGAARCGAWDVGPPLKDNKRELVRAAERGSLPGDPPDLGSLLVAAVYSRDVGWHAPHGGWVFAAFADQTRQLTPTSVRRGR